MEKHGACPYFGIKQNEREEKLEMVTGRKTKEKPEPAAR